MIGVIASRQQQLPTSSGRRTRRGISCHKKRRNMMPRRRLLSQSEPNLRPSFFSVELDVVRRVTVTRDFLIADGCHTGSGLSL